MRSLSAILMVSCALACTKKEAEPTPAAEPIETDAAVPAASDIRTEEVTYTVGDTKLTGYIAWDASKEGPRPGVLVVHEWWGHNDYVRKRARMLAELGYTALALDMYGDGKLAQHPDDAMKFMNETMSNVDVAKARFAAAYELLKQHGTTNPDDIAAVGYCFGGAVVLHMARFGYDLDGVVSFHGNLATQAPAKQGEVKSRMLVLHGAADKLVPPEQVANFKKEMDAAQVEYTIVEFPDAQHSFTNEGATEVGKKHNMPLAYDKAADERSWAEMISFLEEIFPPEQPAAQPG